MADSSVALDFITLDEFRARLEGRLTEIGAVISRMTTQLGAGPDLGEFQDARNANLAYWDRWAVQYNRAHRLMVALSAAHTATVAILAAYKDGEALNKATFGDLQAEFENLNHGLKGLTIDAI